MCVRDDERCGRSQEVNTPELIVQRVRVRVTMLSFWGAQQEIPSEETITLRIASVAFPPGQWTTTTPSLSQTIRPWLASRQFLSLPIVETLLPVIFGYSLSSEPVIMRQLRWKRLWRRSLTRSHRTSTGPSRSSLNGTISSLQPEEITSKGTRVSCVYYQ